MTNAELVKLAEETLKEIVSGWECERGYYKVTVKPTKHNGAFCRVCHVSEEPLIGSDKTYISEGQIGYNPTVYAIAGEENIKKKLTNWYTWMNR